MTEQNKRILEPLAKLLKKESRQAGIPMGNGLEQVLNDVASGDAEAFKNLPSETKKAVLDLSNAGLAKAIVREFPNLDVDAVSNSLSTENPEKVIGALVDLARNGYIEAKAVSGPLYAPEFFARDTVKVAKELCGSTLIYTAGKIWGGPVLYTAAYKASAKDRATASAAPGTIGVYASQGKNILIISAHEPGKEGTVAVWNLGQFNDAFKMGNVGEYFEILNHAGKVIGDNAPLYLEPRNNSSDKLNNYASVKKLTDPKELKGAMGAFKLELV